MGPGKGCDTKGTFFMPFLLQYDLTVSGCSAIRRNVSLERRRGLVSNILPPSLTSEKHARAFAKDWEQEFGFLRRIPRKKFQIFQMRRRLLTLVKKIDDIPVFSEHASTNVTDSVLWLPRLSSEYRIESNC